MFHLKTLFGFCKIVIAPNVFCHENISETLILVFECSAARRCVMQLTDIMVECIPSKTFFTKIYFYSSRLRDNTALYETN